MQPQEAPLDKLIAAAARNNAVFCDRMCRAHGYPSRFLPGLWRAGRGAPPLTPDAVTLPGPQAQPPLAEIRTLLAAGTGPVTVKDSTRSLDLARDGFTPLFDAEWIVWSPPEAEVPLAMTRISRPVDLVLWESVWARGENLPNEHVQFPADFLARHDIAVLVHVGRDARPCAGGILLASSGVVQISNIFSFGPSANATYRSLAAAATRFRPGLPVVGYERGDRLADAVAAGFTRIGPLRVWRHP